jgi:hypothetical protein
MKVTDWEQEEGLDRGKGGMGALFRQMRKREEKEESG